MNIGRNRKIADRILKIEAYCKEKSGRKLQKNAMPVREAVVVIKENTTMQDLHNLSKRLEEELKIRVFQIVIHKDEGHTDKDSKEWKPNYHAHLVADWQDLQTGKTLKHQSFDYSKMQDLAAECLDMERGIAGSKRRLEALEFKIQKKEEELKILTEQNNERKSEISPEKFEELIVKEPDFLGFQKMKTEKTLMNFQKVFKTQKSQLLKNKTELESKSKQIIELNMEKDSLKKEIQHFKNKNSSLLTNATVFAFEKKKYLDSVQNTFEKAIRFEKLLQPSLKIENHQQLVDELSRISEKVSKDNDIPFSAFEEIFKDSEKIAKILNLLHFGKQNSENSEQTEDLDIENKRKNKFSR